jgi:hypothetical protein
LTQFLSMTDASLEHLVVSPTEHTGHFAPVDCQRLLTHV